ncbi:MAG: GxxExxY protein [Candidatus Hydrogenedentes bacterium]|nr:GxxExxY protein [Candidatus Hydrogenedentota bacterium]
MESIYEEALCHELTLREIEFERQVEVDVVYKSHVIKGQRIDVLLEQEVIIELKSVSRLPELAKAQTLSYLKASRLKRALLINFGEKRPEPPVWYWWTESQDYLCDLCGGEGHVFTYSRRSAHAFRLYRMLLVLQLHTTTNKLSQL